MIKLSNIEYVDKRLALIHQTMPIISAGNILAILLIFFTFDKSVHAHLNTWLISLTILIGVRALAWVYFNAYDNNKTDATTRLFVYLVLVYLTGLVWGIGGAMFYQSAVQVEKDLLLIILTLLLSSTTMTFASILPLFVVFAVLSVAPLGLYLIMDDNPDSRILGASILVFLLMNVLLSIIRGRSVFNVFRLSAENEVLIEQLNKQKLIAENKSNEKSKFLAAISHDLRQPMHAMGLFLNSLSPHIKPSGEPVLRKVRSAATGLRSLFNGLLDISRLEAGSVKPQLQTINTLPYLQRILDGFSSEASEKGLTLQSQLVEASVLSDPLLLERVIRNLLANAVQYTDAGQIHLISSLENGIVAIMVKDEGRGIPNSEIKRIFSEYHQLSNPERDRNKGVGLGLAIVHHICKLLSISIQVDSRIAHGSTFIIRLAEAEATVTKTDKTPKLTSKLECAFAVFIDDESDIRDATTALFKSWDINAIITDSGDKAVAQLGKKSDVPSIIIADYRLLHETGVDVIRQIRARYQDYIPAMIITGDTTIDLSKETQIDNIAVLHKPVSPAELRTAIHELTNIREFSD